MKITFMLGKHPEEPMAGDLVMTKLLVGLTASLGDVHVVSLSKEGRASTPQVTSLPKESVKLWTLIPRALRNRKSLIHSRFDTSHLQDFLRDQASDRFVAEHSYMAESFISVRPDEAADKLVVNTHVPESGVLRATHGPKSSFEAARVLRDEIRVAMAARSVGAFDANEAEWYRSLGAKRSIYMDLTLPPNELTPLPQQGAPTLLFIGALGWSPNRSALESLLREWPKILKAVPNARLKLIGKGTDSFPGSQIEGVLPLGFVNDLGAELEGATALMAPITVGGGVRVKLLEAIAAGTAVVGTRDAIGTLDSFLPLTVSSSDEAATDRAIELLANPTKASAEGRALYEANVEHWASEKPMKTAEFLLQ